MLIFLRKFEISPFDFSWFSLEIFKDFNISLSNLIASTTMHNIYWYFIGFWANFSIIINHWTSTKFSKFQEKLVTCLLASSLLLWCCVFLCLHAIRDCRQRDQHKFNDGGGWHLISPFGCRHLADVIMTCRRLGDSW